MQYKHVSPVAVAAVLAAGEIAITLLEVPTGRFADRFGHRRSLILGSAIQVIAMLLCWLAEGVAGLFLASVCVALGDTFRSGADDPRRDDWDSRPHGLPRRSWAAAPGFFLARAVMLSMLTGAAAPLRATAIQLVIEERRAEAASWASALDAGIRTLALLAAGHLNSSR